MGKYAPVHTRVYGHPGVHVHRRPGLSPWTHLHSCMHLFTVPRGTPAQTSWSRLLDICGIFAHMYALMATKRYMSADTQTRANKNAHSRTNYRLPGVHVCRHPLPSPCVHGLPHACTHSGTQGIYMHRAQWAPLYLCARTQPRTCTLGYTRTPPDSLQFEPQSRARAHPHASARLLFKKHLCQRTGPFAPAGLLCTRACPGERTLALA